MHGNRNMRSGRQTGWHRRQRPGFPPIGKGQPIRRSRRARTVACDHCLVSASKISACLAWKREPATTFPAYTNCEWPDPVRFCDRKPSRQLLAFRAKWTRQRRRTFGVSDRSGSPYPTRVRIGRPGRLPQLRVARRTGGDADLRGPARRGRGSVARPRGRARRRRCVGPEIREQINACTLFVPIISANT